MNEIDRAYPEGKPLTRPAVPAMDQILGRKFPMLDHGFIRVIDYMGDEGAIVQAARVSYGQGTEAKSSDRGLLRYLMSHHHSTPFEMCEIKLHVKLPIFVARQWIRHRTANVNEVSARYSVLSREFYTPAAEDLAPQSLTNKQGRAGGYSPEMAAVLQGLITDACNSSFNVYDAMTKEVDGPHAIYPLSRELGRIVLPLAAYTEWYWKIDAHNLMNFLRLRADPHAQWEIRVYAEKICQILQDWMPTVYEAFCDYVLNAKSFSAMELGLLSAYLAKPVNGPEHAGMTARELQAFKDKLGWA
jgi:thymidylate synthase (FAD)